MFSRKAKRKLIRHQKFYYFDTGVFRAIRPTGPLESDAELDGPVMETLVFQELRAMNDYLECGYQLYFWRTKNGLEVDFILYGPEGLIAIEVKRSIYVHPNNLRGLKEFKKDYPPARCNLLYGGSTPLYIDDIVDYFLKLSNRSFIDDEVERIKDGVLKAYRWQYIFSGVEHPRFQKLYNELTTEDQRQRVSAALAALA